MNIYYTTRVKFRNMLREEAKVPHLVRFNSYKVWSRKIKATVTKMKIVLSSGSLGALGKGTWERGNWLKKKTREHSRMMSYSIFSVFYRYY